MPHTPLPKLNNYYLTFGQKEREGEHPTFPDAHPDGFITIVATNMESARKKAFDHIGNRFAFIYEESNFDFNLYSYGSLATI